MEKHKLWKWGLRICICLFLTFVGYEKIMPFFQEDTSFDFAVKKGVENPDLNVNISIYSHYSGSRWYAFVKRKTVVYKGVPIGKFNEKDIHFYAAYFYLPDMKKKKVVSNTEANSNYKYYYIFDNIGFAIGAKVSGMHYNFDNHAYIKYIDLKDNHDEKFTYYDPKKAKYELTELSETSFKILNTKSFEELKETDKILTKDIIRLKKLTLGQKKALIEIHNEKKFDFP